MADNSIFENALIGAPIAAGGIFTAHNILASNAAILPIAEPTPRFAATAAGVTNIAEGHALRSEMFPNYAKRQQMAQLNDLAERLASDMFGPQEDDILSFATAETLDDPIKREVFMAKAQERVAARIKTGIYEAANLAADQARPHGNLGQSLLANLDPRMSPLEMVKDIQTTLRSNSSFYTPRFASAFMRETKSFENILKSGQRRGLETVNAVPIPQADPFFRSKSALRGLDVLELSARGTAQMEKLKESMGASSYTVRRQYRKDKIKGSQLRVEFFRGDSRDALASLNVPEEIPGQKGVVSRGHYQQSRYIAGTYGMVDDTGKIISTFNHTQWMMLRASEDLASNISDLGDKSKEEIRRLTRQFEGLMNEPLDWLRYAPEGQWQTGEDYAKIRSNILRLRTKEGKALAPAEYAKMVGTTYEGETLFPPMSASQAADSVVARGDPAGKVSPFGRFSQYARKPLQFFRPDYQLTDVARAAIAADPFQEKYRWAGAFQKLDSPMMRIAYVAPDAMAHLQGITEEGMGVISEEADRLRQIEKLTTVDVSRTAMGADFYDIWKSAGKPTSMSGEEFLGHAQGTRQFDDLLRGGFVGRDPEGNAVKINLKKQRLLDVVSFGEDLNKGHFMRLTLAETLDPAQAEKGYYGSKQISWRYNEQEMNSLRKKLNLDKGIQAVSSMDILKKDRRAFLNQVFTELQRTTTERMNTHGVAQKAYDFAQSPQQTVERMMGGLSGTPAEQMNQMVRQAWGIAQEAELSTKQLGSTFAAVPHVMGENWADDLAGITGAQRRAISSSQVSAGVSQLFFGGSFKEGMGKVATLEPRAFELLGAGHWGDLGREAQLDISQRLITGNPLVMEEQRVLGESLQSIMDPGKLDDAISLDEYQKRAASQAKRIGEELPDATRLLNETQAVNIPGVGDVMVPGQEHIKQMETRMKLHMSDKQAGAMSDLGGSYRKMLEQASLFEGKTINAESFGRVMTDLSTAVGEFYAGTVNKGLLRSRVAGSLFLGAATPGVGNRFSHGMGRHVVGISERHGLEMIQGLEDTGIYDPLDISRMRKQFKTGQGVGGMIGRHPYIGQYSSQAVEFRLMKGLRDPIAVFDEQIMEVSTLKGSSGSVLENKRVRLSPLVGLAGDTDGDAVAATMAGPQMEEKFRHRASGDLASRREYEAFQIRNQILKAKKPPGAESFLEELVGSAVKMGAPETSLGKLSNMLSQSKGALLASNLGDKALADSLHLLEWFEQGPISGKHIPDKDALKMLTMFEQLETGFKHGDRRLLRDTAREIIGEGNDIANQLFLGKGMDVEVRNTVMSAARRRAGRPEILPRHIPGLNLENTIDNIITATKSIDDFGGVEARGALLGKKSMTKGLVGKLLDRTFLGKTVFGSFIQDVGGRAEGAFGEFSKKTVGAINRSISAGARVLEHARPMAIGMAAAVGVAAMLSSPKDTLDPGQKTPPRANMRVNTGGDRVQQNIGGPVSVGAPTAPSHVSAANTARVSPPGHNIIVRGNAGGPIDYNSLSSSIGSVTGGSVNVSVRDQRSSITPERLSDIIREG